MWEETCVIWVIDGHREYWVDTRSINIPFRCKHSVFLKFSFQQHTYQSICLDNTVTRQHCGLVNMLDVPRNTLCCELKVSYKFFTYIILFIIIKPKLLSLLEISSEKGYGFVSNLLMIIEWPSKEEKHIVYFVFLMNCSNCIRVCVLRTSKHAFIIEYPFTFH